MDIDRWCIWLFCESVWTHLEQIQLLVKFNSKHDNFYSRNWFWKYIHLSTGLSTKPYTIECRYNAVQYSMVLHTPLQEVRQNINQRLNPQKTPHTSPWRASYGVSFVNILKKVCGVMTAPHCIAQQWRPLLPTQNALNKDMDKWLHHP